VTASLSPVTFWSRLLENVSGNTVILSLPLGSGHGLSARGAPGSPK
jgi:hypothetical protein